jgi:hypothetical protein
MIVRTPTDGSLIMIAQTNHAELSGMFAARWGNDMFAPPRPYQSVVRAAIYHDCGWYRYAARPSYDAANKSTPNFAQVPSDLKQLAAYQWGIDWLSDIDPYAGLLISRHRTGIWKDRYGTVSNPPPSPRRLLSDLVTEFVNRNEARQEQVLAELDRSEFLTNYHNLQIWDLLSLYLCTADEPQYQNVEPVPTDSEAANGVRMSLTPRDTDHIKVEPYPFNVRPFKVHYVYKHLETYDFPTENAFREAYYAAVPKLRHFEFE